MAWWQRLLGRERTKPEPVELDLHQQLAVRTLARFGPCSFNRLYDEVRATRPTTQAEMANAILKMDAAGIIQRPPEPSTPQAQRRYILTRRGKRVARYIPPDPRSAIEFYV